MNTRRLMIAAMGLAVAFGGASAAFANTPITQVAAPAQVKATPRAEARVHAKVEKVKVARVERARRERMAAHRVAMKHERHVGKLAQAKVTMHKGVKTVTRVG